MAEATQAKVEVITEEGIRYSSLSGDDLKTDEQLAQLEITIKDCTIGFNSMNQKTPEYGHSIQIILPEGSDFVATDKTFRRKYADMRATKDPNVESYKGMVKFVTQEDVLKKKFKSDMLGRGYMTFQLSEKKILDERYEALEDGKFKGKYLAKVADSKSGTVKVIYKCKNDQYTGEPIKPEVFKIDEDGQKVTTFVNPKTKQEQGLYLSGGDTVTVKIRPYETHSTKDNSWALRYNILEIEQTKTSYVSTGSSKSSQVAQGADNDILSSIFGITETVVSSKKVDAPATKSVKEEVVSDPIPKKETKTKAVASVDVSDIDLSELDDLDSIADMGE